MAQHYSDPNETDPYALPDLEVWEDRLFNVECRCGDYEIPEPASFDDVLCPSCEGKPLSVGGISDANGTPKVGWFWWSCFPGCLPDGEPSGPFATEAEALADARKGIDNEA